MDPVLSPDGEISRVPFAVLPSPVEPQRRLPQTVELRLITSGRTLMPATSPGRTATSQPLVLANPRTTGWSNLDGAAHEGMFVAALLRVHPFLNEKATTRVLTSARNPRLIHIASHGYYVGAPDATSGAAEPIPQAGGSRSAFAGLPASRDDAMLNSGIVLAGANLSLRPDLIANAAQAASSVTADDGYLTAKEVAQLQLNGTELVVLSACDTASGAQQSGEGLFGLQRALSAAGARSTLLSLWKVEGTATAFFMERYYTLLNQGKGRMEALLAVQEEFRTKPKQPAWDAPQFWAAWQLVGESGPMPK